jgi:DNA topoisomerase-1
MKLLIVESPAKAKTIEKYLDNKYKVLPSVGHIRDLPKSNKKAIDIESGFIPHYEIARGKEAVVEKLTAAVKKADEVLLATDPDREGEAIAWHIADLLKLKKAKRVVFHEITKNAVTEAIQHPRPIDDNLRQAQEARRVLDRLVGYDLSGVIWKKVRYGLSAGRVQSPALRIIIEKEREIRAFVPEIYWVIEAFFKTKAGEAITLTSSDEPKTQGEVDRIVKNAKASAWNIVDIEEKEVAQEPRAPFTTSTLQQAANNRLSMSPSRTMGVAQKLYEAGHITYMRTDSTNLSKEAQGQILALIEKTFGKEYVEARIFKTKSKNAQEAHEAIRPTDISKKFVGSTPEQKNLYELIRVRAMASQMAPARVMRTKISANTVKNDVPNFSTTGSRILFPGWIAADKDAEREDVILPKLATGDVLTLTDILPEQKETQPPKRYTEAGLIKELEKRGIGRPSTYATISQTLLTRGYVNRENRTLFGTDTGEVVSDFLEGNFAEYISDSFTAEMEEKLDDIAEGKREYSKTLGDFYTPFIKQVKSKDKLPKVTNMGDAPPDMLCPVCGKNMVIKLAKNGKFLSCSNFPDCVGARTFDGKELAPPKETGEECPKCKKGKLILREGRFGEFIACSNYPKCKFIKESEDAIKARSTGIACPVCKKGEMSERRGRFGIFYSCSNYPDCKYAIKAKPTGNICKTCGALMMEGTKTIPERCSDKTCPNHNPHKLKKE